MADPRQTLHDLIRRFGTSLAEDSQRCKGMLRDLCGSSKREIAGLVAAIEEKIPAELMKPHPLLVSLRANMIRRLEDHRALTPDIAMWTVDTWGLVLGTWTQIDLDSFSQKSESSASTQANFNHFLEQHLQQQIILTKNLQERLVCMEKEHSSLQQLFADQTQRLIQSENECRSLQIRLSRQQRYTLQFKAALERCLEVSIPLPDGAELNKHEFDRS